MVLSRTKCIFVSTTTYLRFCAAISFHGPTNIPFMRSHTYINSEAALLLATLYLISKPEIL